MDVGFDGTSDLNWFAIDRCGQIAHFATGGKGAIPLSLLVDRAHLQAAHAAIRSLPQICEALINPDLEKYVTLAGTNAEARYLRSFVEMAQRGLFSFDSPLGSDAPAPYFLVAVPEQPLSFNMLDEPTKQFIELLQLSVSFSEMTVFDVSAV